MDWTSKWLGGWNRTSLSFRGKITLVNSCLSLIPMCFLLIFKVPVKVTYRIEQWLREFLWLVEGEGKRDHLVRWDLVLNLRRKGVQVWEGFLWEIVLFWGNGCVGFLERIMLYDTRSFWVSMDHILMVGMPTLLSGGRSTIPWRLLPKSYLISLISLDSLWVIVWEDSVMIYYFVFNTQNLFKVVGSRDFFISILFIPLFPTLS